MSAVDSSFTYFLHKLVIFYNIRFQNTFLSKPFYTQIKSLSTLYKVERKVATNFIYIKLCKIISLSSCIIHLTLRRELFLFLFISYPFIKRQRLVYTGIFIRVSTIINSIVTDQSSFDLGMNDMSDLHLFIIISYLHYH